MKHLQFETHSSNFQKQRNLMLILPMQPPVVIQGAYLVELKASKACVETIPLSLNCLSQLGFLEHSIWDNWFQLSKMI